MERHRRQRDYREKTGRVAGTDPDKVSAFLILQENVQETPAAIFHLEEAFRIRKLQQVSVFFRSKRYTPSCKSAIRIWILNPRKLPFLHTCSFSSSMTYCIGEFASTSSSTLMIIISSVIVAGT